MKLTKAQRRVLTELTDEWDKRDSDWKAGRTFLDLEDRGLVQWRVKAAGDVVVGPGAHGHHWQVRRTPAGRTALDERGRGG